MDFYEDLIDLAKKHDFAFLFPKDEDDDKNIKFFIIDIENKEIKIIP